MAGRESKAKPKVKAKAKSKAKPRPKTKPRVEVEVAKESVAVLDMTAVREVYQLVLQGATEGEILESWRAAHPERDFDPAIMVAVEKNLESASKSSRSVLLGFCLEGQRMLYSKLYETSDYAGASKVLKEIRTMAQMLPSEDSKTKAIPVIDITKL